MLTLLPMIGNCRFYRLDLIPNWYSIPHRLKMLLAILISHDSSNIPKFLYLVQAQKTGRYHGLEVPSGILVPHLMQRCVDLIPRS